MLNFHTDENRRMINFRQKKGRLLATLLFANILSSNSSDELKHHCSLHHEASKLSLSHGAIHQTTLFL